MDHIKTNKTVLDEAVETAMALAIQAKVTAAEAALAADTAAAKAAEAALAAEAAAEKIQICQQYLAKLTLKANETMAPGSMIKAAMTQETAVGWGGYI